MPRPTKLTPKTREVILNALRAGMTRSAAAATAGVHRSQMTRWLARYAAFATEVDIAEAQAEARFTAVITRAANDGDTRSALEWLKRRRREDWTDRHEVSGPDGGPIQVGLSYEEALRELKQSAAEPQAEEPDGSAEDTPGAEGL